MFCQAAAVLVALSTLLALELHPAALLAVLAGQGLAVTGAADARLVQADVVAVVARHVDAVVLDGALLHLGLGSAGGQGLVRRQARGGGGQAAKDGGPGGGRRPGRGRVPTGAHGDGQGGGGGGGGGGLVVVEEEVMVMAVVAVAVVVEEDVVLVVGRLLDGSGHGGSIAGGVRHGLASGDAVVGIERRGADGHRVGVG